MPNDAELLRRFAEEKSEAAFAELVSRHLDLVYSAALRQVGGDAHRAKDVAQVVFTTLARKAAALTHHPVLAGWLYTATQHAAAKAIRSESRRHAREQEAQAMHEILFPTGSAIDWERVRPVLDDAMRELGERDREAVLLRFFARRPFAEIGAALNLSEDAARMRVERALDKLHALLARRGVTSTSAALAVALNAQAVAAAPAGLAAAVTGVALSGAGVAGGAAVAAGIFAFMSTGKITAILVAVVGATAIGFGVYAIKQTRRAEAELAAVSGERDSLRGKLEASEARARQAETKSRENEARLAALPAGGTARGATSSKPAVQTSAADDLLLAPMKMKIAQAAADKEAHRDLSISNPDYQRAMFEAQKSGLRVRFGPLYANLNLTEEQVGRFEKRLADSYQDMLDYAAAIQAKGLSPTDPAIATLAATEKAKLEADLRSVLGEAGMKEYQSYERNFGAREVVNSLLGAVVYAGAMLSTHQVNQLTQTIAEQSPSFQKGGRVTNRGSDVNWDQVVGQAAQFLSPPQMEVLRATAVQAQAQAQADRLVRAASPLQAGMTKPAKPVAPPEGR